MAKESARPLEELDLASRQNLTRILGLDPSEMNNADRAFMRARADYRDAAQQKDYVMDDVGGDDEEVAASPAAVELAEENGIDLSTVEGTGANGNITKGDVEKAIADAAE